MDKDRDKASESISGRIFAIGDIHGMLDKLTMLLARLPFDRDRDTLEGDGLPSLEEVERGHIVKVLEKTGYNKGLTAQILGIPRTTLWRKLKAHHIG